MQYEVTIPEDVRVRAKEALDAMLALPRRKKPLAFDTKAPLAKVEMVF